MNNTFLFAIIAIIILLLVAALVIILQNKKKQQQRPVAPLVFDTNKTDQLESSGSELDVPVLGHDINRVIEPHSDRSADVLSSVAQSGGESASKHGISLAEQLISEQRYDDATNELKRLLMISPNNTQAMIKLLQVYGITNNYVAFNNLHQQIHVLGDEKVIAEADFYRSLIADDITNMQTAATTRTPAPVETTIETLDFDLGDADLTNEQSADSSAIELSLDDHLVANLTQTTDSDVSDEPFELSFDDDSTVSESLSADFDLTDSQSPITAQTLTGGDEGFDFDIFAEDQADTAKSKQTAHGQALDVSDASASEFDFDFELSSEPSADQSTVDDSLLVHFDQTTPETDLSAGDVFTTKTLDADAFDLTPEASADPKAQGDLDFSLTDSSFVDLTTQPLVDETLDFELDTSQDKHILPKTTADVDVLDALLQTDLNEGTSQIDVLDTVAADDLGFGLEDTEVVEQTARPTDDAVVSEFDLAVDDSSLSGISQFDDQVALDDIVADFADEAKLRPASATQTASDDVILDDSIYGDETPDALGDSFGADLDLGDLSGATSTAPAFDTTPDTATWLDLADSQTQPAKPALHFKITPVSPVEPSQTAQTLSTNGANVSQASTVTNFGAQLDNAEIALNLAGKYLNLGEQEGAKRLLNEVIADGTPTQKQAAQSLLARIG